MIVGLVKEIKNNEFRVGLTPDNVKAYVDSGNAVYVESEAGTGSGFPNEEYVASGATILDSSKEVWDIAEMVIKVKEPIEEEFQYFREGLILYAYLHLAAEEKLTNELLKSNMQAVAYETITDRHGTLPCLMPMSEIAGKMATLEGAKYLEKTYGGKGLLLGGVTGVQKANVVIIGGGNVGKNACKIAVGLGANVTVFDMSMKQLSHLDDVFGDRIQTLYSTKAAIEKAVSTADLIIGAVLIPGGKAPKLVTKDMLKLMQKGTVIVDVAVDQGGCIETTKVTTHENPTFIVDDIVHYCVGNMPGALARTATIALTNSTLYYGLQIANKGLIQAAKDDSNFAKGINCYEGKCYFPGVAEAFGLDFTDLNEILS